MTVLVIKCKSNTHFLTSVRESKRMEQRETEMITSGDILSTSSGISVDFCANLMSLNGSRLYDETLD